MPPGSTSRWCVGVRLSMSTRSPDPILSAGTAADQPNPYGRSKRCHPGWLSS
jgi:hypothetical protein